MRLRTCIITATFCFAVAMSQSVFAQQVAAPGKVNSITAAAELLPPSTVVFAQIPDPDGLVQTFLDHPAHERIKAIPGAEKAYNSPQVMQVKAGIAMIEFQLGMTYYELVKVLGGDGITAAFDLETKGAALLLRTPDPEEQSKALQRIIGLVKKQRRDNNRSEVKSDEYRGVKVYQVDKVRLGVMDGWIVVTNNPKLGKSILDASLDHPQDSLATSDWFKQAVAKWNDDVVVRAAVNLADVRDQRGIQKLLAGTKSNPVAEFLVGGVFENLKHSPFVAGQLQLDDDSLSLNFRTPHDREWIPEEREFFFGPNGSGVARAAISTEGSVLNISVYRDIAKMWLYGGDLFNQQVNDGMAEAESNLSTLFAGRDFVEEILGLIKPEIQLVVREQSFANRLPIPALKLPAFALVGELKNPAMMQDELRRTYQSIIGFFNVVGAMNGNPQLDQDIQEHQGAKVMTASFIPTPEDKKSKTASVHYNFSPSLALTGEHFVLSSSLPLAKQLAGSVKTASADDPESANLRVSLKAAPLKSILTDNQEFLISNNMLEEGHTREEAEQNIGLLLTIVGLFDGFSAKLLPTEHELNLDLELTLAK
jgi:hypothetical protein